MAGAIPITFRRMAGSGGMPELTRVAENNNVTSLFGTPVALASGYVQKSAAIDGNNNLFLGFCTEIGKNRATAGTAETLTYGSVRNQANAVNIPLGAPMDDGKMGVIVPQPNHRFQGALTSANNSAQNMVGATMGLTEDSNNYWYIDPTKNNQASGGCIVITELIDAVGTAGGKLEFSVIQARVQTLSQQT